MTGKLTEVLISTIVPAFNEAGNIDEFCRQFDEMQKTAGFKSELVIVDDGSSDETFEKITRTRVRKRRDFVSREPLSLYNYGCAASGAEAFLSFYRVLEFCNVPQKLDRMLSSTLCQLAPKPRGVINGKETHVP